MFCVCFHPASICSWDLPWLSEVSFCNSEWSCADRGVTKSHGIKQNVKAIQFLFNVKSEELKACRCCSWRVFFTYLCSQRVNGRRTVSICGLYFVRIVYCWFSSFCTKYFEQLSQGSLSSCGYFSPAGCFASLTLWLLLRGRLAIIYELGKQQEPELFYSQTCFYSFRSCMCS